ncbi:MAG: hypothetical protein ACT4PP_02125 [Sporichthyaceae bacterium]
MRGKIARLLAVAALVIAGALGPLSSPAGAHVGGSAVVLVTDLVVAPVGGGWEVRATLADFDSGDPVRGADVKTFTGNPVKATTLAETTTAGTYTGAIGKARPGPMSLTMKVRSIPGNEPVEDVDKTWQVDLVAGAPAVVVSGATGPGGGSFGLIVGVAGAVLAAAMLYGLYSLRRRSAIPPPPRAQ